MRNTVKSSRAQKSSLPLAHPHHSELAFLQAEAVCTRAQAEILVQYDHHRVQALDRWGIMITYPWMPLEEALEPLVVKVIFNPAPHHLPSPEQIRSIIFKHPLAPQFVQDRVDTLSFHVG